MWPFSRKPEPTSGPEPAPATPQVHFDWKALPSIQRTIADHPLTVPTESFASDLSTHDDPRAVANPLGHKVTLEAPPGIVLGIARPQTRSDGPELIPRPHAAPHPAVQRVIDESVASEPHAAQFDQMDTAESAPPAAPLRRLAASGEPIPSVQLTRVTPGTEPTPVEPEIVTPSDEPRAAAPEASQPTEETTPLPSYPRLTLGQARRLGLGAPIKHVPETATSVQRISEVPTRSVESTTHPTSGIKEESAPKFEPFILDYLVNTKPEIKAPAPISRPQRIPLSASRSMTAQRTESAPSEPTSEKPAPPELIEDSTSDSNATPPSTADVVQRDAQPAEAEDVPVQLTPMSTDVSSIEPIAGPPSIAAATNPSQSLLADAPKGEANEAEGEVMPPLALALASPHKETSDASAIEIKSSAIESVSSVEPSEIRPSDSVAPLVSDRPQLLTQARPPIAISVQRSTESTAVSTQRATDTAPAAARPTSDVVIQRDMLRSVASLPEVELPSRAEAMPSVASGASTTASASSMTGASLSSYLPQARPFQPVFAAASSVQRSATSRASEEAERWSPVQTSTTVLERESEEPSLPMQRAREWTMSAAAELESGPSLAAAGEARPQPSTPGVDDEERMEDMAARLYERIRTRLRNELLVDRERAGFLTDLR
ncbi:MAG TPA: hypothetical protein VM674_02900 [Candidatus Acidoferrum sp.]|nr:hypothetical protein [Candidatus Acidoferrum sp.]